MIRTLFHFLVVIVGLCFTVETYAASLPPEPKRFKIFMVLWTGKTDLEKGFISYLKSKNVLFDVEVRDCEGDRAKCHNFVKDIRDYKPDLVYTWGTPACEEIAGKLGSSKKEYIWDIPIVSLIVTDPINSKLIYNLDKPGRNVTGVNHVAPIEVQINSILLYNKDTKVLAAIYNPDETNSVLQVKALQEKAKDFDLTIHPLPVPLTKGKPDPERIVEQVDRAHELNADFIYTPADTFLSVHCAKLVDAANRHKIPTFASTESMYWKGEPMLGMLSRFINVGLFGGFKAYEILVNKKDPSEIPYEKLTRFSLIVSKKTYEKIGLVPPIPVLKFAEIRGA